MEIFKLTLIKMGLPSVNCCGFDIHIGNAFNDTPIYFDKKKKDTPNLG